MSVTLGLAYNREEHRWGVFENMVLRRKLGPKREQLKMIEKFIRRSFMTFTPQQIFSMCHIFHVFE
jgi:hypothetical protein